MIILSNYRRAIRLVPAVIAAIGVLTPINLSANKLGKNMPDVSIAECAGSASLYPEPAEGQNAYPDTLTAIAIAHAGRHGARFASSNSRARKLMKELERAKSEGTATASGERLGKLITKVLTRTAGRWGALDSIGEAEQRGIADRMYENYDYLFGGDSEISAIASYVPRCVMSMDVFTHQLATHEPQLNISSKSGPANNELLRPFSEAPEYLKYREQEPYNQMLEEYKSIYLPKSPARRLLGGASWLSDQQQRDFSKTLGEFIASIGAAGLGNPADYIGAEGFMTAEEYRGVWAYGNLTQYVERTANEISVEPAEIARPLLADMINTLNRVAEGEEGAERVTLRFGHAETMMPLLSLMRLPGCFYMTDDYGTVAGEWQNFHVVPMASNLQLVLFEAPSGKLYLRASVNERPVSLTPGGDTVVEWGEAKALLESRL
ncbi:MAG: histidine phosphatase family protein [Muribaculaceae bacterium]|nr:histidine phosphatase family protein [Muribaculaceae bacterium]